MSKLPPAWTHVTLASITTDSSQRIPSADEQITYIDISAVDRNSKTIVAPQRLSGGDAPSRARKHIRSGDTLVSMTRPNLNAVALVPSELDGQIASTGFDVLRPREGIDPRWIAYLVRTEAFVETMSAVVQGALYPAVRSKDVRSYQAPLAPSAEQTRIADQLDKLLARVQACNDRLDAIPALLKRFRQTVLTAAIAGDLTKGERSATGCSSSWPAIPLGTLGELGRGKSRHRPRNDPQLYGGEYPFVQTGDVAQSGGLIIQHRQTYSEFGLQQSRLWPTGTICITIAANIADTAILTYPACFPDSVVGFIADPCKCLGQFVKWSIDVIKDDLEAFAPATAQKNINLAVLNEISIRCPSLDVQAEIIRRVEALFKLADSIEARYTVARAQAQRLTPLLLAKAFRGELVSQDPNDEPTSVMLERITTARMKTVAQPRRKSTAGRKPVRAPKENTAMTKSRQDNDVLGQPYLARHLRLIGGVAPAEALFKASELPVADFYKQLAWEVAQGHLRDGKTVLELGHAA